MSALTECRWFTEGNTAATAGQPITDCPYGGGSPKAILWQAGWTYAKDGSL